MKKLNNNIKILIFIFLLTVILAVRFSYALQLNITSDNYEILDNTIIVTPISKSVKVNEIKSKINFVTDVDIYNTNNNKMNDDDYVGTGFKLKAASTYYDIVVLGDTTGDGSIDLGDVSKLYNHLKYNNILSGVYLESGKITRNDTITLGDVSKLYNFYKGKANLTYYNKNVKLTDYDNLNVSLNNPSPGDSITRTFSVKNSGSSTEEYNIYLSEIINNFNDKTDLVYTLESTNGCSSEERVVPSITGNESKIVSSCSIPKNKTHTYTLKVLFKEDVMPQEDNTNVSFSAKISLNDFKKTNIDSESIIAETVNDLKSKNIQVGQHAVTMGYSSSLDGGNGYYVIEAKSNQKIDNGRFIELNNGNIAKLIPENKTINTKQYGLIGDGDTEESSKFQLALKQLQQDDCDTIYIPNGSYNMSHTVLMYPGNIIGGNDANIIVSSSDQEYFLANDRTGKTSSEKDTININSLKFEVNKQKNPDTGVHVNHIFIIRFFFTDNSSIRNCEFTTNESNTYGVNPIDLYTSNTNTRIDNINSRIFTHTTGLTTHICIRERYNKHTTKNIIVSNVYGEKNGQDESIWIDAWYGILEDVEVYDSTFIDKGVAVSTFYMAANYENSEARNINVHNNTITKENYSYKILSMGIKQDADAIPGSNENLNFHDNTIIINSNLSSGLANGSTIVTIGIAANKDAVISDIYFENNTIISESALIGDIVKDNIGIANVKNNNIRVNNFSTNPNYFLGIYDGVKLVDGGTLSKTDGSTIEVKNIFRNCLNVQNITTSIKGEVVNDYNFTGNANYKNLNITSTGKVFNITGKSTSVPTYNIENSTFKNSDNSISVWYTDLNSGTSNDNKVTFNITNTTFTNNNRYGSITINNN